MSSNKTGFRQGRLGIGKEPIFPLDISGSMRIEGDLVLAGTIADIQGNPIEFGASSATFNMDKTFPDPTIEITEFPDWSNNVVVEGAGKFEDVASKNGDIYYNGGNVGIGTADPGTYKLKVAGSVMIDDYIYHNEGNENTYFGFPSDDSFSIVTGGSTKLTIDQSRAYFNLDIQLPSWIYHKDDTDTKIGFSANDTFQVVVNGNNVLYITGTTAATHKLSVNDTCRFTNTATFEGNITASKIGIGAHNSDSSYKLDVWGNARFMNTTYFENSVYFQTSNIYMNSYLVHNGDTDTKIGFPSNDNIYFYCTNLIQMRINTNGVGIHTDAPPNSSTRFQVGGNANISGNLGIGTTSPDVKLDVNGEAKFSTIGLSSTNYLLFCGAKVYDWYDTTNYWNQNSSSNILLDFAAGPYFFIGFFRVDGVNNHNQHLGNWITLGKGIGAGHWRTKYNHYNTIAEKNNGISVSLGWDGDYWKLSSSSSSSNQSWHIRIVMIDGSLERRRSWGTWYSMSAYST